MKKHPTFNIEQPTSSAPPPSAVIGCWMFCILVVLSAGCATTPGRSPMTLKDAFHKDFPIGVAVNQRQFTGEDTKGLALITSQFNSLSPENVLKWEAVHPRPGTNGYNFAPGDAYVEFGEKNHML